MNYDEQEQPLQPIKKIDDEVLDKFINTYGFKREVQETKKGEKQLNIASASIDNNIYIIRKDGKKYYFLSVSKENFDNFKKSEKEGFTFKFIDFDTRYFKKNEQKFIKSLKENKMFDDIKVKDGDYEDFGKKTIQTFTNYNTADRIKKINPKEIKDIQPEPIPEKKELMGDDDEEEEEERMDDDEEEEERPIREEKKDYEEEEKPIEQVQDIDKKKMMKNEKKVNQKKRTGKIDKKDNDVFDQLTTELNFTRPNETAAKSYLRVGDDVIFIRKPQEKQKGVNKLGKNNYFAVKLNKEDVERIYTGKDLDKVEAEYFNFSTDYFNRNKDKIKEAIKNGEFILDDELKRNKEKSGIPEKFKIEDLRTYDILPGKKKFDYVNFLDLKNGNISKKRGDDGQQIIEFSKDGKNVTVNLPNKYLSNGYPDSLLKLIVGVSENNKGEVDFKEIGEIQDLNGDITNLYSDMQDLKSKINSSNNAEEKERLLIKYNKKRLKLEDLIKKYSKEAYRLSTLKKKKATMATHKYLMNKLNKLKT